MNHYKCSNANLVLVLEIVLVFSLFTGILTTNANSTELYLEWETIAVGEVPKVGGYITIADFPNEFHGDQTYKVNITITVERLDSADAIEFKTLNWTVDIRVNENEIESKSIGYSVFDKNLTKGKEISAVSYWSMREDITAKFGTLNVTSVLTLQNSTDLTPTQTLCIKTHPKLTFKSDTRLAISPRTRLVEQGDNVRIQGTLFSKEGPVMTINRTDATGEIIISNETVTYFEWPKIELVYTNPKGEQINRSTNLDSSGNFTDSFKPNVVGRWFVEAKYAGSDYFSSSTSNLAIIYVNYRFPLYFFVGLVFVITILFGPWLWKKRYPKEVNITEEIEKEKTNKNESLKEKILKAFPNLKQKVQKAKPQQESDKPQ